VRANGAPLPRSRGARGSGDSDGRRTPRGHRGPLVVDVRVRTRPRKRILTSPVAVEVGTARRAGTAPQPPRPAPAAAAVGADVRVAPWLVGTPSSATWTAAPSARRWRQRGEMLWRR
jgi:hypothetical protein